MRLRKLAWCASLVSAAILLNGCATSALWEEGRFARFHEPTRPANLRLFQSPKDVLVQYDESCDADESIRRRAYWLGRNHEPQKNPHKPRFVSVRAAQNLEFLPVFDPSAAVPPVPDIALYAIVSTNGVDFSLYSTGRMVDAYELPVYEDASGRTKQVLLTPLAVAADLTIIGGIIVISCWPTGLSFSP